MTSIVVGIDVGGTFTDIALLEDGRLAVHKLPSTPDDPSRGIAQGIAETGVSIANADFIHGSTVATNALLEGKGGRTALITTMGFEDVLEIGRQNRADLYDLNMERPAPLAPWQLRFGLPERIDYTGAILDDLTPASVDALLSLLADAQVDGIAVSFLFSFLNPVHEETLARRLSELPGNPFISISSKILPEFREYERTSTVVVNSYVGPVMARYLTQLESTLGRGLRIMQSSGGSITASLAAEQPVRTILSGPAGGVVGAFYTGVQAGYPDIITLDMGGTSTDVSLCPGRIKETTAANLGGYPVSVPMIEIHTVGAGGGSIARIDAGGALVVGPQSAGADPGPACYGRGDQLTVTDANLALGRLRPDGFLGGRMTLDKARADTLLENIAAGIGTTAGDAALGIIRVVNSNMERAIRAISLERGYDPREFTLIPFGGAGPMHACELAAELGIPRVLVPGHPGILSALGVAIADVVKDYSRTVMLRGADLDPARLETEFHGMEQLARAELVAEGLPAAAMTARRFLDVRYVGQSFELTIDCPPLDLDNDGNSAASSNATLATTSDSNAGNTTLAAGDDSNDANTAQAAGSDSNAGSAGLATGGDSNDDRATLAASSDSNAGSSSLDASGDNNVGSPGLATAGSDSGDGSATLAANISDEFYQAHWQRFGYADRALPVEIVNLRLKLELAVDKPHLEPAPSQDTDASPAVIGVAEAVFAAGPAATTLYDRERLQTGNRITGPALLLQLDTTIVVPPEWGGVVDAYGNLLLEPLS